MTEKNKKPEIRFKGFTEYWEMRELGEMAETFEYGLNAAAIDYDGINKYIRITDIDDETREFNTVKLTSPGTNLDIADNYKLKEGDLLFARTGASVGKTYHYKVSDGLVYYAGFLIRARIKPEYDIEFVFQNTLTNEYNNFIRLTSQRSGQPGVNAQEYSFFKLMAPKLSEQSKIGTFFKHIDYLITLNQRKYNKLATIKKSMLEKMFPKNAAGVPEIRFKGFTEAWEERKLNEICKYYTSSLSIGDAIVDGKYNLYDANKVIGFTNSNVQTCDYITIIKDGSGVGRVRLLPKNTSFIGTMGAFHNKDSNIHFLFCCLVKTDFRKHITGATIPHIYFSNYGNDDYYVPNTEEQTKIGEYFNHLDNLLTLQQRELEKLKNVKKACLEKMFV